MQLSAEDLARFEHVAEFIRQYHRIQVTVLQTREDMEAFHNRNSFGEPVSGWNADGLWNLIAEADRNTILHITDDFRLHTLIFFLQDVPVILGPFRPLLFSQREAAVILQENGIEGMDPEQYLSWADTYPFHSEKAAVETVRALLHTLYPYADDRSLRDIQARSVIHEVAVEEAHNRENYALRLQRRYAFEKQFRDCIQAGNQRGALEQLRKMEQDVAYLKRIGSTLDNEKIGAAITRTTARLAAMDGGLPGIVADRISNQNTKDTLSARTVDEISRAKEKMIREYCAAVRQDNESHRSVLVESILYEMERNYASDISLDGLAKELAISKNYLISRFREEMGETPARYLTVLRLHKAAELLAQQGLSIQGVACAVGIPDSSYFAKLFQKEFGETPMQYRKAHAL